MREKINTIITLFNTTNTHYLIATTGAYFLHFLFNAYMGRVLSVEDFGLITFMNTLILLLGIFINAYGSAIAHRTAFLATHTNESASTHFFLQQGKTMGWIALGFTIVWIFALPFSSSFFRVDDVTSLFVFTIVIPTFLFSSLFKGYLTGMLRLQVVAIALILEGLSKIIFASVFQIVGITALSYVAIPLSIVVLLSVLIIGNGTQKTDKEISSHFYAFPRRFFLAAVITGFATSGFITIDVLLVKHYLLPAQAGEYGLLALAGKMIYFFGALFNSLILVYVSRDLGARKNPIHSFYRLLKGSFLLTGISFLGIGIGGTYFLPFAFGEKVYPILQYLLLYSYSITLFTFSSAFTIYHLARHHLSFSALSFCTTVGLFAGVVVFHADIGQIVRVIAVVSTINFFLVIFLHLLQKNGKFIVRNLVDLKDLFSPIPNQKKVHDTYKRMLVFNWRDTRHKYAGGAEVYIHELSKRWVKKGHSVTLFCGNDGNNPRNEVIDGVQMVRRGGFYFVYIWAFVYYVLRFRGRYDVIIDTQNGIPFFTPLYAKEKVYCLMFHVHQEVFRKSLRFPLSLVAQVLENRFMPWVYRNTKYLTISSSSKKEIEQLDLGKAGIEIVFPGIESKKYSKGEKTKYPMVLYTGRLQYYKSVHLFLQIAKILGQKIPKIQFVIAGDGTERKFLFEYARELGIISKVKFLGKVSEKEKISLYQSAWVFVNPSMQEGWGMTSIESSACGTPVVASRVAGLSDSVKNPHTGFLVPYGDVFAFAKKIELLITDNTLRKTQSNYGAKWAKQFDWEKSAQKAMNFFI